MRRLLALIIVLFTTPCFAQAIGANPTYSDCSISSMSGSSQSLGTNETLGAHGFNRKYLLICNTTAVAGDTVGVNLTGGTAAIGGTGTLTLAQGECREYGATGGLPLPPANAINVIGTSTQPVFCVVGH